ncbi:flagellar biosynthetic protein FliR [Luedemannella flava]
MESLSRLLSHGLDDLFIAALQIAGPLIAVLFCTDVALGLLNRVAPRSTRSPSVCPRRSCSPCPWPASRS